MKTPLRLLCLLPMLSGCMRGPAVDLAPKYQERAFVVPASWHGSGPFVEATPSDATLRSDWWVSFRDPVLTQLEQQAMAGNPDLEAAAERFVQARDEMMKARSQILPHVGIGSEASSAQQSHERLFRSDSSPIQDRGVTLGGLASWEPDFWSRLRNATRVEMYRAEERAADYALARLSIQAELASDYFTLRGLDARNAIFKQTIEYYQQSLAIVQTQFQGAIASGLDVARAEYQLANTQARQFGIEAQRQVVEHAIAALVNEVPAAFTIAPLDHNEVVHFQLPAQLPSKLVERRPDVAGMEREMAQANRAVGIARAAFFPSIGLSAGGGFEGQLPILRLFKSFWSYGAELAVPAFQGGYLRAQLQQSWSAYRETEDRYRSTVLSAFREVEDGLSMTSLLSAQVAQQEVAIGAARKAQDLSMELYKGGLASTLELITAQVNTLEARLAAAELKAELQKSVVDLIRALGGGFHREDLPKDGEIQPFGVFQARGLDKPKPAGGIDVDLVHRDRRSDLTRPVTQ